MLIVDVHLFLLDHKENKMISWSDVILFKIKKKLEKINEDTLSEKDSFIFRKQGECPPLD